MLWDSTRTGNLLDVHVRCREWRLRTLQRGRSSWRRRRVAYCDLINVLESRIRVAERFALLKLQQPPPIRSLTPGWESRRDDVLSAPAVPVTSCPAVPRALRACVCLSK